MKIKWFVAVAVCVLIALPTFAEDGINEIGTAFVNAVKARDFDALASLYTEDAISYSPDMMIVKGRDAIRDSWAGFLEGFDLVDLVISNAHHETCDDLSTAWGQFKMILVPKDGGDEVVMEGRFADVAKKIDGRWQYVMDHASMPVPSE